MVASRYGTKMQGCSYVALTKLDVLSYMEKIPVCTAYEIDGNRVDTFPSGIEELKCAKPIYEYLPGFQCDISGCRTVDDLPKAALEYIRYIEKKSSARLSMCLSAPNVMPISQCFRRKGKMQNQKVLILNFGGQYDQLIARRVRNATSIVRLSLIP